MDNLKIDWEKSYRNKDNFVFYPHEEVIRFVSKYIRKRVGFNEFQDVARYEVPPAILDLGCGIGRHVIYSYQMGLDPYGVDLSDVAISLARDWALKERIHNPETRIVQADIRQLPWEDQFFQFVVSHGVLDSMKFEIACDAMSEVARVMKRGGLFYCDLVSGDSSSHYREYDGEEIVVANHEQGTIQSYFNYSKILKMINGSFDIVESILIRRENISSGGYISRYHLVLRRK